MTVIAAGVSIALGMTLVSGPVTAGAQPDKVPQIGVLSGNSPREDRCLVEFRRGLGELGLVEGKTHTLQIQWAEGRSEPYPRMAADLVRLKVDLIVAFTSASSVVAKEATRSIPIVMASSTYPVETGLVASLARPGGNITGVANFTPELMAKRVQLLKEAAPTVSRVAVLRTEARLDDLIVRDMEAAARQLGLQMKIVEAKRSEDLPGALQAAVRGGAQAMMNTQSPFFALNRVQIAQFALKHRLPSLSGEQAAPDAGALLFYGPYIWEGCHRAAGFVERILGGAKPADLPVEQPAKVQLVVNLKTARALGLTLPPSILARADRVIE